MPRWEPDASRRLEQAALELFVERGYDQTTAAAVAERAGLTERTFFRHFADKREVLFARSRLLEEFLVQAVAAAPVGLTPLRTAVAALEGADVLFPPRREDARERQSVITANPELAEREQAKLRSLVAALTAALEERGTDGPAARLAAEVTVLVLGAAFPRWAEGDEEFSRLVRSSLEQLVDVVSEG